MSKETVPLARPVSGVDPAELALRHFEALNGMSSQAWFVLEKTRPKFLVPYVEFIDNYGPACFEALSARQCVGYPAYANNIAFRNTLADESKKLGAKREAMSAQLAAFAWVSDQPIAVDLMGKAVLCVRPEWVVAKTKHIDGLELTPLEKALRLESELDAALAEQNAPKSRGDE